MERVRLKTLVDKAVRARSLPLQARYSGAGKMFCTTCGIGSDNWTPGCRTCGDRWRRWRKVGAVTEQRFREEKYRVEIYAFEKRVVSGGFSHGKPPVSTWADHRRNFGMTSAILPKRPRWSQ